MILVPDRSSSRFAEETALNDAPQGNPPQPLKPSMELSHASKYSQNLRNAYTSGDVNKSGQVPCLLLLVASALLTALMPVVALRERNGEVIRKRGGGTRLASEAG